MLKYLPLVSWKNGLQAFYKTPEPLCKWNVPSRSTYKKIEGELWLKLGWSFKAYPPGILYWRIEVSRKEEIQRGWCENHCQKNPLVNSMGGRRGVFSWEDLSCYFPLESLLYKWIHEHRLQAYSLGWSKAAERTQNLKLIGALYILAVRLGKVLYLLEYSECPVSNMGRALGMQLGITIRGVSLSALLLRPYIFLPLLPAVWTWMVCSLIKCR